MKPDTRKDIERIHARFVSETGMGIPLSMETERTIYEWFVWSHKNTGSRWDESDLLKVLSHLRKTYDRDWWARVMKFSRLFGRPEVFAEDLAMSKFGKQPKTNRERILAASGRPQTPPDNVKKPNDFLDPTKSELIKAEIEKMREATR